MTKIALYDGCWVKTRRGDVCGPLVGCVGNGEIKWFFFSAFAWNESGIDCGELFLNQVIAVYASLAEASAANPDM